MKPSEQMPMRDAVARHSGTPPSEERLTACSIVPFPVGRQSDSISIQNFTELVLLIDIYITVLTYPAPSAKIMCCSAEMASQPTA